jgi:hypothetical protein
MKTRWTTIRAAAIAAAILCILSASGAWAGDPLSTSTFDPAYPVGGSQEPAYETAVATLPGLGLLPAFPDGKTQRCSTNGEAELFLVISAFNVVGAAEFVCDAIPSPGKEVCFAALSVVALANEAAGIANGQCAFQDGLVNAAEIQAAFENTKIIHADLGLHDDRLIEVQTLLDVMDGKLDDIIRLLNTPTGRRPDFPIN